MKKNSDNLTIRLQTGLVASLFYVVAFLGLAMFCSACHLTLGTPDAIREYHRGLNGMISEGKASPDKEGAYWQTQKQHDGLRLGGQ